MIYPILRNTSSEQKSFLFDNFTSPIFDEVKDPHDLQMSFNKYPIIPFFGNREYSSDSILKMLHRLAEVTPIVSGVVDSIANFTAGGGFMLKRAEGLGVINKQYSDVDASEVEAFEAAYLDTFIDTNINSLAELQIKSLAIDGNAGLRVRIAKGANKAQIEYVKTTKWRYLESSWNGDKAVMIANSFLHSDLTVEAPEVVPVYPAFSDEDGIIETFIHVKNQAPNRSWYGLSNGAASLMHQYLLNQLYVYLSAEVDNRFTGKVFFDAEVDPSDVEGDYSEMLKSYLESQRDTFTNKGTKKASIMNRFRAEGQAPATIHEFKANTEHEFYRTMNEILSNSVLTSYGWDKRLIGDNTDAGLFGEKLDAVYMGASQKVKGYQEKVNKSLNIAMAFVSDQTGIDLTGGNRLMLNNLYQQMRIEQEQAVNQPENQ